MAKSPTAVYRNRRGRAVAASAGVAVATLMTLLSAPLSASGAASSDRSPVDLGEAVNLALGLPARSAVVHVGPARIEVLSPTLLRLEYSPTQNFENDPTVNAVNRRMGVTPYRSKVIDHTLVIRTAKVTLRYNLGTGPFSAANTSVTYALDGQPTTIHPTWEWECPFDQVCQGGAAALGGGAALATEATGYDSSGGYVGYFNPVGASATWNVTGVTQSRVVAAIRYSNTQSPVETRKVDVLVNNAQVATLSMPPTTSGDQWSTVAVALHLTPGTDKVQLRCQSDDTVPGPVTRFSPVCGENFDTIAFGPQGGLAPTSGPSGALGGWFRGFDDFTNEPNAITCGPGESGATCQAAIEPLHTDGLLASSGYDLLDDTHSALLTADGWVTPRPVRGDEEDGYLFAYGRNYKVALKSLAELTGPAPLLPRYTFGVWYSDYTTYSSSYIEHSIVPAFRSHDVPLDTLLLDTDWKAPNNWDGWEWSKKYFSDAGAFLKWATAHGIHVALNIHSSVDDHDPALKKAESVSGHTLASSSCTYGPCKVWDWSSKAQAESNFALQQPFERQGVSLWWLDWCCDASDTSMPGVTPDAWIDHLYAQEMVDKGERGFVLGRIGASEALSLLAYPAGPWSNHTSSIAFTGDAWGTWNTLAAEAQLTPDEATIGEPYVSDDIGSYHGPPPGLVLDAPDLYDRWVQLGTFEPIERLHSADEDRLPWEYPEPEQSITESFLRLREALVPYTYTLADQAHDTGMPIDTPLYIDYPNQLDAYAHRTEFLYGPDMVVDPVTVPGADPKVTLWLPPGTWKDFFTGTTYVGNTNVTMSVPLDQMPVFVKVGSIIPEQPSDTHVDNSSTAPLTLNIYAGGKGQFTLYDDAGSGLGYTHGQYSDTTISDVVGTNVASVTIRAAKGTFPGQASTRTYRLELIGVAKPTTVRVGGKLVHHSTMGATGWSYDRTTHTLTVATGRVSTHHAVTVEAT